LRLGVQRKEIKQVYDHKLYGKSTLKNLVQESRRLSTLSKLQKIGSVYGEKMVLQILHHVGSGIIKKNCKELSAVKAREAIELLKDFGVTVKVEDDRNFVVTDEEGVFRFKDDRYHSGIVYILYQVLDAFDLDVQFKTFSSIPNTLSKFMDEVGTPLYEDVKKKIKLTGSGTVQERAQILLVTHHIQGLYDTKKLVYKLQGGQFENYRKIKFSPLKVDEEIVESADRFGVKLDPLSYDILMRVNKEYRRVVPQAKQRFIPILQSILLLQLPRNTREQMKRWHINDRGNKRRSDPQRPVVATAETVFEYSILRGFTEKEMLGYAAKRCEVIFENNLH